VAIVAKYYQKRFYILDVRRARLEFRALQGLVISLCRDYRVGRLLIEDASSGQQLIQMLRPPPKGVPFPIGCKPEGSKEVRFHAQASRIEGGEVVLPPAAPWLAEFVSEIAAFPGGRFDDQADALAQLLRHGGPIEQPTITAGPILFRDGEWIGGEVFASDEPYMEDPWGA
jgi:predicted phage terminase large subunit-like protein